MRTVAARGFLSRFLESEVSEGPEWIHVEMTLECAHRIEGLFAGHGPFVGTVVEPGLNGRLSAPPRNLLKHQNAASERCKLLDAAALVGRYSDKLRVLLRFKLPSRPKGDSELLLEPNDFLP